MTAATVAEPGFRNVAHENLRTLCVLRVIPLSGMLVGIHFLLRGSISGLRWDFIFALLAALILVIALTWWRSFRPAPVTHMEFFGHLVVDIGIYSLLMFNTGGAANPFISYLLVPITVAAIALPPMLTWLVAALCLATYTLVLFWHVPLPLVTPGHDQHGTLRPALDLHVMGMWLNFMVSALLIAYFINRMSSTIAAQRQTLYKQQRQQMESEQLLAVATLAASATHELGTPLNTMKLVTGEWRQSPPGDGNEFADDLTILEQQIDRCQQTLQKLAGAAREYSGAGLRIQPAGRFFRDLLEGWLVMRPDVKAQIHIQGDLPEVEIHYHPSLSASIHNLLNNAGDASPHQVAIDVSWDAEKATLTIRDQGIDAVPASAGKTPLRSSKPTGMGLGLFLARTILARHSAQVEFQRQQAPPGTLTRITLPLRPDND